jgi:hypothetical protein
MDKLIKRKDLTDYIVKENIKTENSIFSTFVTQMKAVEFTSKDILCMLKWFKDISYHSIPYDIRQKLTISKLVKDVMNLFIEFIKLYPKNKNLLDKEIEQMLEIINNLSYYNEPSYNNNKPTSKINIQEFIVEITKKTTLSEKIIEIIMRIHNCQVELDDYVKSKEILLNYQPFCEKILYKKLSQDKLDEIINILLPFDQVKKINYTDKFRSNFNNIISNLNQHQMKETYELWKSYIEFHNKINMKLQSYNITDLLYNKNSLLSKDYNLILDLVIQNIGILTQGFIIKILPLTGYASVDINSIIDIFKYPHEKFTIQNVDLLLKHINNVQLFQLLYTDTYNDILLKKVIIYHNFSEPDPKTRQKIFDMKIFNHCYKSAQLTQEQTKDLMNIALNLCKEHIVGYLLDNKFPQDEVDLNLIYTTSEADLIKILETCNKYNIKLNIESYTHCVKLLSNLSPLQKLKKYTIYENEPDDDKNFLEFIETVRQNNGLYNKIKYLTIEKCLELITNNELNVTISDIINIYSPQTREFLYNYLKDTNKIKTVKTVKTLKKKLTIKN